MTDKKEVMFGLKELPECSLKTFRWRMEIQQALTIKFYMRAI